MTQFNWGKRIIVLFYEDISDTYTFYDKQKQQQSSLKKLWEERNLNTSIK